LNVSDEISLGRMGALLPYGYLYGDASFNLSSGTCQAANFNMSRMNGSRSSAVVSGGTLTSPNALRIGASANYVGIAIFTQSGGAIVCRDFMGELRRKHLGGRLGNQLA